MEPKIFKNRKDAALQLAHVLDKYKNKEDVIVLGIPKGGVESAFYIAKSLGVRLSMIIARKLSYPTNPEAAFGAVAEDGSLFLNEHAMTGLSKEMIEEAVEARKEEVKDRIQSLRQGKPLPELKDKTVILVDDGIATGATVFAAIETCKSHQARRIVVAAPVAGAEMKDRLKRLVDEVFVLEQPYNYFAVSQVYQYFPNVSEVQVAELMKRWEQEQDAVQHQ